MVKTVAFNDEVSGIISELAKPYSFSQFVHAAVMEKIQKMQAENKKEEQKNICFHIFFFII